jgi:hypothetical protein
VVHKFGYQCGQLVVRAASPTELNAHILAFDQATLAHAFAECAKTFTESSGDRLLIYPITGVTACSARAVSGHTAAPPSSVMKARRFTA